MLRAAAHLCAKVLKVSPVTALPVVVQLPPGSPGDVSLMATVSPAVTLPLNVTAAIVATRALSVLAGTPWYAIGSTGGTMKLTTGG